MCVYLFYGPSEDVRSGGRTGVVRKVCGPDVHYFYVDRGVVGIGTSHAQVQSDQTQVGQFLAGCRDLARAHASEASRCARALVAGATVGSTAAFVVDIQGALKWVETHVVDQVREFCAVFFQVTLVGDLLLLFDHSVAFQQSGVDLR